jgi:hypothetical protein
MRIHDITKAIFIFVAFSGINVVSMIMGEYKKVKQEWPKYKCNPSVMPFASFFGQDTMSNFTACMGEMNMGFMGYFLAPIYSILNIVATLGKALAGSMNGIRGMFSFLRFGMFGIFGDLIGMIVNLITKFQIMIINIKGLVMKMLGIALLIQMKLESIILTGSSIWNGPIGGSLRGLANMG